MNIDIDARIQEEKRILKMTIHELNKELEQLDDAYLMAGLPLNYGTKHSGEIKKHGKSKK